MLTARMRNSQWRDFHSPRSAALLAAPAISRLPSGFIEMAESLGASSIQIIYKILIPEALPNIVKGLSGTLTHLIGYSTIAGALGCGGLGSLLIQKGYHLFQVEYVLTTLLIMVVLTHLIQLCGNYIAHGSVQVNASNH